MAWQVEAGTANLGFASQPVRRERVRAWRPPGAAVVVLGDRVDPTAELGVGFQRHDGRYRRRLTGNLTGDPGVGETTRGDLAQGVSERDLAPVSRVSGGVPTQRGVRPEAGHEAPWSIARDCWPTRAAGREYGARWALEPRGAAGKSRGVQREDTHLRAPERLERLLLRMALVR